MKPVLIFDLDDTLILQDGMTVETVRYCTAFLPIDPAAFWAVFREGNERLFAALPSFEYCCQVGISAQEALWGDFGGAHPALNQLRQALPDFRVQSWHLALKHFGFPSLELARDVAQDFVALRGRRYYPFAGTRSVLEELKNDYTLAILTNGAPELQWSKVHKSGLEDLFSSITVSGDYSIGKPRSEIFEAVFAKHPGVQSFIMIGNSLSSDIRGARNAGIPCIWYIQGDEPTNVPVQADAEIRSIQELPAALRSLKR